MEKLTDAERRALTDQGREMDEATRASIQKMKEALPSAEQPKGRAKRAPA